MINLMRNLIKRCRVTLSTPDDENFPSVQVSFNGKVRTVEVIMPYGLSARIPVDALGHKLLINGNEDDQAAIFNTPTERFKLKAEGEVAIGNPKSGSVVYFRENGDIQIIGKNAFDITVDAGMNLTVAGGVTINADVTINGTLKVSGDTVLDSLLEVDGIDFATHVHGGVTAGGSNTGVAQ